jgi:hypothetical protein
MLSLVFTCKSLKEIVTQHIVMGYTVILPVILQQTTVSKVIVLQSHLRGILLLPIILH